MLTSIGPSLDALRLQSGASTQAIALLFTANSLGYIAGSLLAGRLYPRFAGHRVLPVALLILAALTVTIPWHGFIGLLVVFGLIGIPLGVIDVGGNTLLVWLYRERVAPYMNVLHLSFGVGALAGPLVFDRVAVATGNAVTTFWLFAALMIPVALWVTRLPTPGSPVAASAGAEAGSLRRYAWPIGLLALFFFLHMGAELAFGGWVFTYGTDVTASETTGRVINSAFWGGLVVGRIVAVPLALRLSPVAMLAIDLLGALACLALVAALPASVPALWVGAIGFGLFVASMIPSTFNLAERRMPFTSQVSSLLLVGGSLGAMSLPWLVGQLYATSGRLAMIQVTAGAMLAAVPVLWAIVARAGTRGARPGS
jgi:FHS family Na+ dependent glucose MFS transporter 1